MPLSIFFLQIYPPAPCQGAILAIGTLYCIAPHGSVQVIDLGSLCNVHEGRGLGQTARYEFRHPCNSSLGHVNLLPINIQESEENAHTLSPTFSLLVDFPQMHGLNFKEL